MFRHSWRRRQLTLSNASTLSSILSAARLASKGSVIRRAMSAAKSRSFSRIVLSPLSIPHRVIADGFGKNVFVAIESPTSPPPLSPGAWDRAYLDSIDHRRSARCWPGRIALMVQQHREDVQARAKGNRNQDIRQQRVDHLSDKP